MGFLADRYGLEPELSDEQWVAEHVQHIKRPVLIFCGVIVLVLAAYAAEITTRKQRIPDKQVSIEKTYRGKECILLEMTKSDSRTRAFRINGKTVMAESDENNDGFFESVMIFDPETEDFEWFNKTTNGAVIPVTGEKLNDLKSKKTTADRALHEWLKD